LKQAMPGLVTGKLSDFAGITLVSLLLLAMAPSRPLLVCAAVAAGFAFWKGPYSQTLIDTANHYLPYAIGRVIDYSDLLALLVMPFSVAVTRRAGHYALGSRPVRNWLVPVAALLTIFGVSATSMAPVVRDGEVHVTASAQIALPDFTAVIAKFASKHRLECGACDSASTHATYLGDGMHMHYSFQGDKPTTFTIRAYSDNRSGVDARNLIDKLLADLERSLSRKYRDLTLTVQ
jgi:hypothetical protein